MTLGLLGCTSPRSTSTVPPPPRTTPVANEPLTRIAFGSCNRQAEPQPLWNDIRAANPDLWIWLGDNIYADTKDMTAMASMYARQQRHSGYRALRQQTPVIGTWDDHDYGANDAGRLYPKRDSSQQLFLDFLGVPENHPRRERDGVYSAHTFGPPGKQVKVILLDTRYHRDPLTPNTTSDQRYVPNEEGDILGDEQWAWLEEELRTSDAQIHLIGTSIQAIPEQHNWEKWANFPQSRERFFDVLRRTEAPGVLLLSGDRHHAELSRMEDPLDYPLYELTASGLTHHAPKHNEPNRHRLGRPLIALNYGLITIDWNAEPVTLRLQVRGANNEPRINWTLPLPTLQPGDSG